MGNSLESDTRAAGRYLHDHQMARFWKIPNDLKITSGGFAVFAEQTPCDFMGFTSSGRALLIECKECKASSLSMGSRGLKPHQWLALQECHDAGGIAVLLWRRKGVDAILDVDMIRKFSKGKLSIPWSAIPPSHFGLTIEQLLLFQIDPGRYRKGAKQ